MNTFRHNYNLVRGFKAETIIAPRCFINNHRMRFVHVSCDLSSVVIYNEVRFMNNTCIYVVPSHTLKLYSNKKGMYFNYSYSVNFFEKKIARVYICD